MEDAMKDLRERHENKVLAIHNVPIGSFHNSHVTMDLITHEVHSPFVHTYKGH